jgi:LPXTG-motif cell wall-anchored protein
MLSRAALLATILALFALAAPAAWAQSAGDEQYQDPFGDEQSTPTPTPSPAPTPAGDTAQAAPTPTPAPTAPPTAVVAQTAPQLPRTGNDPITPAVAGFWLLLGGVALRARVRERERGGR